MAKLMLLSASMILSPAVFSSGGPNLKPITPTVDHSKKATCGIKWTFDAKQPIKYFRVFRSVTEDFWDADLIAEVGNTTTRLTDWGAEQYTDYNYWVIPYNYDTDDDDIYDSNVVNMDLSRYLCANHRYWGNSDVYLTASVKSIAIGSTLPLYFKVNMGTSGDPLYDHVKPDNVRVTRMTDLSGKEANDIAAVFTNRDSEYALHEGDVEGNTYLKANGSFGFIRPFKPGIVYFRAYYKSATTVSALRIEVLRPTFNLYAPEGDIDIFDNMYRDLYLKCNGKFVSPSEIECTLASDEGPSAQINLVTDFTTEYDNDGNVISYGADLYDNAFGFIEMWRSDDISMYDIKFNDILVKEYQITPVWDYSREMRFFYLDTNGRSVSEFSPNKTYYFGVKYGDKTLPHTIHKYGYYWTTYDVGDWGFVANNCIGSFDDLGTLNTSTLGELGYFSAYEAGWLQLSIYVIDRRLTDGSIRIKNN